MNSITHFFQLDSKVVQSSIFVIVFLLCWFLESFSEFPEAFSKRKHFFNNFIFSFAGAVVQFFIGIVFLKIITYENVHQIGLLHKLKLNSPLQQLVFSFVFLDFFYWVYHFLMHKVPFLWRFHAVHHSDSFMTVSTALREHPIETFIRLGHYILAVAILGPALWLVSLHQFIQIVSKIIIHGNFRLPEKTDKIVSYFLLTPNMHQVHHHYVLPFTDSNYGDLFSIWDRLFRTFYTLKKDELKFGLDEYPEEVQCPEPWYFLLRRPFMRKTK